MQYPGGGGGGGHSQYILVGVYTYILVEYDCGFSPIIYNDNCKRNEEFGAC